MRAFAESCKRRAMEAIGTPDIYRDVLFMFVGSALWGLILIAALALPYWVVKLRTHVTEEDQRGDLSFYLLMALFLIVGATFAEFRPISMVFLGTGFSWSSPAQTAFSQVEEKLGDAVMIAGLIAIGVDRYVKGKLLTEVARDVLSFAAGHDLPPALKQRVSGLIRVPYYRRDFQMRLTLAPLDNGLVRVTMRTRYIVYNLTDASPPYVVKTAIEKSVWSSEEPSRLLKLELSGSENWSIFSNTLPQWKDQPSDKAYLEYGKETSLSPAGGVPLKVKTKRSSVYPQSWYYVLDILDTTADLTIITDHYPNFTWQVEVPQRSVRRDPHGTRWPCPGVYLPGQFVRITWTRDEGTR
jgi:hypothetical protein